MRKKISTQLQTPASLPQLKKLDDFDQQLCQERLRQARLAFNLYIATVILMGATLLLITVKSRNAALHTGLSGIGFGTITSHLMRFYRETNDRLDQLDDKSS